MDDLRHPSLQQPQRRPRLRHPLLTVFEALLLLAVGTVLFELAISLLRLPRTEIWIYAEIKGGFALLLAAIFCFDQGWLRYGFTGKIGFRYWPALLPLWIGTLTSLAEGQSVDSLLRIVVWIAISAAVAFGEEGIFRGIILDALLPRGPTRAVVVSAVLFGLSHLIGLFEIDARIVVAQAVMAIGLGLCLGWVRVASRSIWPCVLAHTILDGAGLLVADGVKEALRYTLSAEIFLGGFAALAIAWGIFLLIKYPLSAFGEQRPRFE